MQAKMIHRNSQAVPIQEGLTISQVARLTGIRAKAIRYYESIGLLPRPQRGSNGYRRYSMAEVNLLSLLRSIRALGIPLSSARPLLSQATSARCYDVQQQLLALVKVRLITLDQEIAELQRFRGELESYEHALESCPPERDALFRACVDLCCIDWESTPVSQEEQHEN